MSVSHAYFYSFRIIFTFQRSLPAVLDIITQDSERLFFFVWEKGENNMPRNQFQRMVFAFLTLLANWLKLICFNFPFAFFSQIFFIQPFVRWAFGKLFAKDIAARNSQEMPERPQNEQEAIADIYKRMAVIQENLAHERRQRKKLAEIINEEKSL